MAREVPVRFRPITPIRIAMEGWQSPVDRCRLENGQGVKALLGSNPRPSSKPPRIVFKEVPPCPASPTSTAFESMSKRRRGFPSETNVKRGLRIVHGSTELVEKLGRNDLCPCGSGRRFQEMLHAQRPLFDGSRRQYYFRD